MEKVSYKIQQVVNTLCSRGVVTVLEKEVVRDPREAELQTKQQQNKEGKEKRERENKLKLNRHHLIDKTCERKYHPSSLVNRSVVDVRSPPVFRELSPAFAR